MTYGIFVKETIMKKAICMDKSDNVAIVTEAIFKGDFVSYSNQAIGECNLQACDNITIYHKIAIKDIKKGESIYKYGEKIGIASVCIRVGEHVHVHNVSDFHGGQ